MLWMIIERFRNGDPAPVGERFTRRGRMPPAGVEYVASWVDPPAARCFSTHAGPEREALDAWIAACDDLVDFEVVPVVTSAEYCERLNEAARALPAALQQDHIRQREADDALDAVDDERH